MSFEVREFLILPCLCSTTPTKGILFSIAAPFTGNIPPELCGCTALRVLVLEANQLQGEQNIEFGWPV